MPIGKKQEEMDKSNRRGDKHDTRSIVAEADTENYQDLPRAEANPTNPHVRRDSTRDLSGVGTSFPDKGLTTDPIVKIK
ncbi:hypothetical protein TMatcc_008498 [Talaromyces marneffei ATCC 18224]|uniref:Uncharacterized protein n=2 Tax=Talaromyces marneffei TaxID=37727 RepID=B6QLV0_TALMQ|nr:uncharacterized protein EYB26_007831 [Talaromyces marneffei]EEA22077.1 hypothetical protein PMAA_058570 [Talaromyces marneffei ATCC 18224]KAE8550462.1 hypothetical protein EYB25_006689 [Talaromyces marneffei]QGA20130.1 hypothetical protein EYB26_007831 [Talaromyces marneffei]